MARKLKTLQTSLGFYGLAIAAPSMNATLEAWGAGQAKFFHQGIAEETDDRAVIAATMAKPAFAQAPGGVTTSAPLLWRPSSGGSAICRDEPGAPARELADGTRTLAAAG